MPGSSDETDGLLCKAVVGIPWSIDEFIAKALHAQHPRLIVDGIPKEIHASIDCMVSSPLHSRMAERSETLRRWLSRALSLKEDEDSLKSELPDHCRRVLYKKRLLLFGELLAEVDHPDTAIASQMAGGFDLVGRIPASGVFSKRKSMASITPDDLRTTAKRTRVGIVHSIRSSGDDIDRGVYAATRDELDRGWLHGPYKIEEIPRTASVTRRFGVKQGYKQDGTPKIRPIDNFTESQINLTNSSGESVTLHGTDTLGAVGVRLAEVCGPGGILHGSEIRLRTWDLHKAYKNLALSQDALQDAYLAVYNPESRQPEIFGQYVLPFGACASVNGFCRVSHGVWAIGVKGLKLIWCAYFDDFVAFCLEQETTGVSHCVSVLFSLLGWAVAEDKENAFSSSCKALGLVIDMESARLGCVMMGNTERRKGELSSSIADVLLSGRMSKAEAQRLRGRLLYAESQVFGRRSTKAMGVLSEFIHRGRGYTLSEDLRHALTFLREKVVSGKPRTLHPYLGCCMHIYTDASFDTGQGRGGIGCVLLDPSTGKRQFICIAVSRSDAISICCEEKEQPIFELETFAIYVALKSWSESLRSRPVIIFTDNDGALGACISCRSANQTGWNIVSCICSVEELLGAHVWYERVNTASNLADLPSRMLCDDPRLGVQTHISFEWIRDAYLSELVEQGEVRSSL